MTVIRFPWFKPRKDKRANIMVSTKIIAVFQPTDNDPKLVYLPEEVQSILYRHSTDIFEY